MDISILLAILLLLSLQMMHLASAMRIVSMFTVVYILPGNHLQLDRFWVCMHILAVVEKMPTQKNKPGYLDKKVGIL